MHRTRFAPDPGVGPGIAHHLRQMLRRQIGRAKHETPCDTVELDERERRAQLVPGGEQHAPCAQLLEPAPEARAAREIGERNDVADAVQPSARDARAAYGLPERLTWQSVRTT